MNRVLVIDDELVIRKGIKRMVEKYPRRQLDVHSASNGLEALDILDAQDIQVVFTDIRMPKMDGLALSERINMEYPETLVVIISGYDDFDYAKKALRYGVREYLLKPVLPADIYEVLDKLIDEYESMPLQLSLSEYETWMDHLEETLWKLEKDRLPELLDDWEELCIASGIHGMQLAQLLRDALMNIKNRMIKRSFHP